jgi:hypothetical protein
MESIPERMLTMKSLEIFKNTIKVLSNLKLKARRTLVMRLSIRKGKLPRILHIRVNKNQHSLNMLMPNPMSPQIILTKLKRKKPRRGQKLTKEKQMRLLDWTGLEAESSMTLKMICD